MTALVFAALAQGQPQGPAARSPGGEQQSAPVYRGRECELAVRPPLIESDLAVDGSLSEAAWRRAAVLTGFSQFTPQDDVAAADSTQVLVWYSPSAMHFGVRAFQPAGTVRATLPDRDKIFNDDNIQILLGTYNDRRQATVLMVNPLGVQADGNLVERGTLTGGGFSSTGQSAREAPDLSPDFVYHSKGRVTEFGYEIEISVPFKSLRYQSADVQKWDINVVRQVNYRGYEDSWAPARRGSASFLAQGGTVEGITRIRRGLVMDITPELTQRTEGLPDVSAATPGDWSYDAKRPNFGGNVRWGLTNNFSLNGTFNPDFSQVEADATPVQFDPRQAVSFPEKRPFFLDGSEQYATPNNLVYSRRIVQPVAAVKLSGKSGANGIALLSAIDSKTGSATRGDNPLYNIIRLQRDLGSQSRIAMAYTDKIDGQNFNRVLDVDGRQVWRGRHSLQYQVAQSFNRGNGRDVSGPLWDWRYNLSGRRFSARASFKGISDRFITQSGFLSRTGQVQENVGVRFTRFGARGTLVEQVSFDVMADGLWDYKNWLNKGDARDKKSHYNLQAQFRGGWSMSTSLLLEVFGYDPAFYGARYRILRGTGDTVAFTGTPRLPNRDFVVSFSTPRLKYVTLSNTYIYGQDENFAEWSAATIKYINFAAEFRPTDQLRITPTYTMTDYLRKTDGTRVQRVQLPRLRVEYQVTRNLFVRAIGEYASNFTDVLRDDSRTNKPLLVRSGSQWVQTQKTTTNNVRGDFLISYRPTPGTVFYAGYSALMREPKAFGFEDLNRTSDALFVKLSYLFRY
ncbi:MAG: DUF5916 domain-containing protein [Gemmatimonadota bacterium]|nr:DUF5916 domain-containing protein [Gemmatimonadota bacterium]